MPAAVVHGQQVADDGHEHKVGDDVVRLGYQGGDDRHDGLPQIVVTTGPFLRFGHDAHPFIKPRHA